MEDFASVTVKKMSQTTKDNLLAISKALGLSQHQVHKKALEEYVQNHKELIVKGLDIMRQQKKHRGE